jgi:archaeosine synthase
MTDHFEVTDRDGPARLGELRLADPVVTPAVVDDADRADRETEPYGVLADAGSLWPADRAVPDGDSDRLTVLPHRAFPGGTDDRVAESFDPEYPDVAYPSAAVVSEHTAGDRGTDAYVLSEAPAVLGHGAAVFETLSNVRTAIPEDTALYCSGVATPANVATLAWAGVDIFDPDRAVVAGTRGRYLTTDGRAFLEDLRELPCACPACQRPVDEFDREDCVAHNVNALVAAVRTVRERIRAGRLRDYLDGQMRHEAWLTATVREYESQYAHVERRTPVFRDAQITAATEDAMRRVEIQRFANRVTTRYRPRFDDRPLVLVPCSAAKPYGDSQSHGQFRDAIGYRAHKLSMTSPIGVVPQELETTYPAQHYDSVVTGDWSAEEYEFVASVLRRYLARADYPRVVAHVPPDYRPIVERVAEDVDAPVEYTVEDHPTTDASLAALAETLHGEPTYDKRTREHHTLRAIADYQFGDGAGDDLFDAFGDVTLTGRYPRLQVRDGDGTQFATMVPQYGLLSFTLAGATRWADSAAPTKRVEIDGFVPHGSVLAPGVVDADDEIRPGDEVLIEGPAARAVGRAKTHGAAMVDSTRGVACSVRHVAEK